MDRSLEAERKWEMATTSYSEDETTGKDFDAQPAAPISAPSHHLAKDRGA